MTAQANISSAQTEYLDLHVLRALQTQGFSDIVMKRGETCAVKNFAFTTGLVVGVDLIGYRLRYCYEHAHEARDALKTWSGEGHPGGSWIKCKGAGIELLNPALRD